MARRYCKRFRCSVLGDKICCTTCHFRRDCAEPCLNHPSRCKLEDVERRKRDDDPRKEGRA